MIPEEAIKKVRRVKGIYAYEPDYEALDMAISALEKQIPAKLGPHEMDCFGRARPVCGNCGEVITDAMWDFCPWCGQKIGYAENKIGRSK